MILSEIGDVTWMLIPYLLRLFTKLEQYEAQQRPSDLAARAFHSKAADRSLSRSRKYLKKWLYQGFQLGPVRFGEF